MKNNRSLLKFGAIVLLSVALVTSCKKDNKPPDYTYYISKELKVSYTKATVTSLIGFVSASLPGASTLQPLVVTDINVYKMVYKTIVNGQKINASGLICIPVTPGDYPVLSFQNGTNTVNANAPSVAPSSLSYQMIEIMASMGYIVVIADYPGFGESTQIPHPYLVKEPTVQSLVDMLYATKELAASEISGITMKDEYYLLGYSQGGWATLALHKALELDYSNDFNLKGSVCGAGPYDISLLMQNMLSAPSYSMPVYLGYILNAYSFYNQFTNPVSDIFKEPYASRVSTLYTGLLTSDQINSQLTTSIPGLITSDFLTGYATSARFSSIRDALNNNSISAWHSNIPLLLIHGGSDTQVNPISTENMYFAMIQAGTSPDLIKKTIIPNVDHGDGLAPAMIQAIQFLINLRSSN